MDARAGVGWRPSRSTSPGAWLADRVVNELARWPGLQVRPAACGTGSALALGHLQIVHLPGGHEAELRLGTPALGRLGPALTGSGQVIALSRTESIVALTATEPEEPSTADVGTGESAEEWVRIRMDGEADIWLILSLASIAITANTRTTLGLDRCEPECPRARRLAILSIPDDPAGQPVRPTAPVPRRLG